MIDRDSAVPLARQIRDLLAEQISRGELRPGDRLPTEQQLCDLLRVSRKPVRTALSQLTEMGLVRRHPGRGTFVNSVAGWRRPVTPRTVQLVVPADHWAGPLKRAVTRWNQDQPHHSVKLAVQVVAYSDLYAYLTLAVAHGTAPDLALIDSVWVAEFAERGYLQPLETIDFSLSTHLRTDFLPALLARSEIGGRLLAMPAEADVSGLWFRKDWIAAEDLTPPTTWPELIKLARHFQQPQVRQRYALGCHPLTFAGSSAAGEATTFQLLPVLWSAGADVLAAGEVVLNSPAAVAALTFLRDLVNRYQLASPAVTDHDRDAAATAIASGHAALAIGGSYEWKMIGQISGWAPAERVRRIGIVPFPAGPHGSPASLTGGLSYAIFRQSHAQRLSLELLALALQPEALLPFCTSTGQHPPTRSAMSRLSRNQRFLSDVAQLWPHARARWPLPTYTRISAQLAQMFEDVIAGRRDPAAAAARTAAMISAICGLPEHQPALATSPISSD